MRLGHEDCKSSDELKRRLAREATIYLDGKKVPFAIIADEEEGYVVHWPANMADLPPHMIEEEMSLGYVEIRDPKGEHIRASYKNLQDGQPK